MTSVFLWALAGTQFIFLMTALGAAAVFFFAGEIGARPRALMLGFAGGVMTAASVWSLLLPAIAQSGAESALPAWLPATAGLGLGAGFLALAERLQKGAGGKERLLFTAITLHNIPEGAAVSLPMRQLGMRRGKAFLWGAASGAVEPVFGMLAFCLSSLLHPAMPWLLGFAAGAMLYVTARELSPESADSRGVFGYLGGFALMMVLDVALG